MIEYFNEKGELKITLDTVWDNDGDVRTEIYNEARTRLTEFPANSEAVKLFYAEEMACGTNGNYDAETLYRRAYL